MANAVTTTASNVQVREFAEAKLRARMRMGVDPQSKRRRVTQQNSSQSDLKLTPPVRQPSTLGQRRARPKAVPPLALHRLLQPLAPCFQIPEVITRANLEPPALQFQIAAPPARVHEIAAATADCRATCARALTSAPKDHPKPSRSTGRTDVTSSASTCQECVVDSSTSVPGDLFESLMRLGAEARSRGQHMMAFTGDEYPFRHRSIVRRDLCVAAHAH